MKKLSWSIPRITIESLSFHGGRGVGRLNGAVVFVPLTAPGDVIDVEIVIQKQNYQIGKITKLLEPSAARVTPQCPVFGRCGGCAWQHISYDEQVVQKQKILEDCFRQITKKVGPLPWASFVRSPLHYRYRNRIQVHRRANTIGFLKNKSHDVIAVDDCWIAEEALIPSLRALRIQPAENATGKYEIARREDGTISVTKSFQTPELASFAQVNALQNQQLVEAVLRTQQNPFGQVLDLYCGAGNFSLPFARKYPSISTIGVDLSQINVARATDKANQEYLQNTKFIATDVDKFLVQQPTLKSLNVILDPPRTGLSTKALSSLVRLRPKTIAYVSCNPMTLVRDLERLLQTLDYNFVTIQGFDMFPQTAHIEVLVALQLREGKNCC